ncbi:hypothetical protein PsorP6_006042 [Peronosclerospora sorghi]|uniref:Uncharacterized protein n=1 Tax=Peronosclerospora sorghi TaxID=230839 RepID=A0ACC0W836_9STRA|nr:hypothetical protein PsorP6_006042 [Peronosclerospora sorghi]
MSRAMEALAGSTDEFWYQSNSFGYCSCRSCCSFSSMSRSPFGMYSISTAISESILQLTPINRTILACDRDEMSLISSIKARRQRQNFFDHDWAALVRGKIDNTKAALGNRSLNMHLICGNAVLDKGRLDGRPTHRSHLDTVKH